MNHHRYEDDLLAWSEEQAALLRNGETSGLDWQNLAEEIESLGKSQKSELRSRLALVIQHLLKYRFQPSHRSRSWSTTIRVQRDEMEALLADNPSMRGLLADALPRAYRKALSEAISETGLALPDECPFTLDQIMDPDWLPD